jgi:hypothetical protein
MLPKDKLPTRPKQFPDVPHDSGGILNRTENLDTHHGIQTSLGNPLFLQRIAIFNAGEDKLIPTPETGVRFGV